MRRTQTAAGLIIALMAVFAVTTHGNNVRVETVGFLNHNTAQNQVDVQFDLSWENSWRNALNHDAAWVFVKFRAPGSNAWQHALLSTAAADHRADGGVIKVGATAISGTNYGMGVFIYSAGMQTGNVEYVRIRLRWDYGASGYTNWQLTESVEISVLAIEMVYVDEGAFYVGSGGTEDDSFTDGGWPGDGGTIPFAITNEAALIITNEAGHLWAKGIRITAGELPAAFPKGVNAFYCMKYQITQGQYADFLNLLTQAESAARYVSTYNTTRYLINRLGEAGNYTYSADAPDRACNYFYWLNGLAYAAWSGLRPMSELEYEKACRGPAKPVANEYAWGSTWVQAAAGLVGGDTSGTNTYSTGNANYNSGIGGPVRVGVFATNGANRVSAGASFWGIMELSGNLFERPVWAYDTARSFAGTHGNGTLAPPADWPGNATFARGGFWDYSYGGGVITVSARIGSTYSHAGMNDYFGQGGFRCVRTAP